MNGKVREQAREAIAAHDAAHPYWRQEKRDREIKEAEERARQAQEAHRQVEQRHRQQAANNSKAWCDWVDQRIAEYHTHNYQTLVAGFGEVIAKERAARRKEVKAAIDEAKQWVNAKFETLERRVLERLELESQLRNKSIAGAAGQTQTLIRLPPRRQRDTS